MFDSMLARVRQTDHHFTVYADERTPSVEGWFSNHSVEVERRTLTAGVPAPFLSVERNGEFVGVISIETVERLLEPPIVRPESHDGLSPAYRALFEVLEDTVYTSMKRAELAAISGEIEDRAHRFGAGTLHAGFQRLSTFQPRVATYRRLAANGVDVHVYGKPNWEPPTIPGVTYHTCSGGSLVRFWVLAFESGPRSDQYCGLLAREEVNGYTGFWTDEAETVEELRRGLEAVRD